MTTLRNRSAFTLLETMLALVLLSVISATLVSWLRVETSAIRGDDGADKRFAQERWLSVLRDDIYSASEVSLDDARPAALTLRTCHALPGEDPGWEEIVWRPDATSRFMVRMRRGSGSTTAIPVSTFEPATAVPDAAYTVLWLSMRGGLRVPIGRIAVPPE